MPNNPSESRTGDENPTLRHPVDPRIIQHILNLRVAYPTMPPREIALRAGLPPHLVRDTLGETDPPTGFRLQ
jgi:hypothetical protein